MDKLSQSLRRKLLLWLLVPLVSLFVIRAAYTYFYVADNLANRAYDRTLLDLAGSLEQHITTDMNGRLALTPLSLSLSDEFDQVYFVLRDAGGHYLAGNNMLLPPKNLSADGKPVFFDSQFNDQKVRSVTLTLRLQQAGNRLVIVEVAETLNKRRWLSHQVLLNSLLPQVIILLLAPIVVWIGIGKGLAPLGVLQRDLARRSHLDLSPLDETIAPKELRPIIGAINDLMSRLSRVLVLQNRFSADAAHQLRTPLAGLKAQVELLSRQSTLEDMRAAVAPLSISINRMTRLVNQLLALARSDHESGSAAVQEPINLNELVSEVTREWVPAALKKNIDLGFHACQVPVLIQGNPQRLQELIGNLLDNAIRYTPDGGRVTTRVTTDPPTLAVQDNGDGIPPEQRQQVFERFYRVLGSRAEGSGLGLAIVQEIAKTHGATVRIDSPAHGNGTVASVIFPACPK